MWREFHLLQTLWQLQLPVPQPVAARCEKLGPFLYRGDLITQRIPASRTLAETLRAQPVSSELWRELGATLARFHEHGAYHADLNANNILLDENGRFYLIDFDRGDKRHPDAAWQQNNLDRLQRSLNKLQRLHEPFYFSPSEWAALQRGYRQNSKAAAEHL
jgi:3-deoxy-D-manno-octulosonic acid kinase